MIRWVENKIAPEDCSGVLQLFSADTVRKIQKFHKSFPQYSITPLRPLDALATKLGTGGIYVKDESYRFGLGSFKALGCTFAMASCIASQLGCPVRELDYHTLPDAAQKLGQVTFFAATDGNHGRAVAWAAKQLGQKAVIYMNKGCSKLRLKHIQNESGEAYMTDANYDDTIRYVKDLAEDTPGGVIIQDTGWEGYEEIPKAIMQGYAVMVLEACRQLDEIGITPTHVVLQAGVGAFAGAAQAFIANYYGAAQPVTFIVEPNTADCYLRSALKGDGIAETVGGDMPTIMAGLACGEPNPLSWEIIKNKSRFFTAIDDCNTENAMRVLANPSGADAKIVSGESGAAGMGFLLELLTNSELALLRKSAGVDGSSKFLVFSTEGDTDPESYAKIIRS